MEDVIGYGGYGGGYGLDIIGQRPPVGVPPYGFGFPAGDAFYPVNGGVNPFAAMQMAQAQAQAQAQMQGGWDPNVPMNAPMPYPTAEGMMIPADAVQGLIGRRSGGGGNGRGGWGGGAAGGWGGGWGGGPGFGFAGGFDGGFGCGVAPLTAPLAIQQNYEPLVGLAPRCPTRFRTEFVGFGGCTIDPCQTVTLQCSPCTLMKIIRFVIPSSIAFQLTVDQITIGGKETLINCGPVPAAMFVEDATFIETIQTETIQPGCCIAITLTNISNAPVDAIVGGVCRNVW